LKLYYNYILKNNIKQFLFITLILVSVILLTRSSSFLVFITEKGVGLWDFFSLFILITPWFLTIIIPASLFISVLISFNQMISNNEITILKNSGLSKFDIIKPVIILSIICSIICYIIAFYLMPMANKNLKMKKYDFQINYSNIMISPGIFEHLNDLTISVEERQGDILSGILIYDNRNPEYSATITAIDGQIEKKFGSILIHLGQGTMQRFNNKTHITEILRFDNYVIDLNQEGKEDMNFTWKARERYFNELFTYDNNLHPKYIAQYKVEVHKRITMPLFSLILTLIASSLLFSGSFNRRGNLRNILKSIFLAILFITCSILIYNIMEKSIKFAPLIYLNFALFLGFCSILISRNKLK
jgi:lipopolysaccharide export system permease protein